MSTKKFPFTEVIELTQKKIDTLTAKKAEVEKRKRYWVVVSKGETEDSFDNCFYVVVDKGDNTTLVTYNRYPYTFDQYEKANRISHEVSATKGDGTPIWLVPMTETDYVQTCLDQATKHLSQLLEMQKQFENHEVKS